MTHFVETNSSLNDINILWSLDAWEKRHEIQSYISEISIFGSFPVLAQGTNQLSQIYCGIKVIYLLLINGQKLDAWIQRTLEISRIS